MAKQVRADLALFEVAQEDAIDTSGQELGEAGLPHAEGQLSDVLADGDQHGVELDLLVMLAAVEAVEVGAAIYAQQNGFPVDHKRALTIPQRCLGDQRIAVAPV